MFWKGHWPGPQCRTQKLVQNPCPGLGSNMLKIAQLHDMCFWMMDLQWFTWRFTMIYPEFWVTSFNHRTVGTSARPRRAECVRLRARAPPPQQIMQLPLGCRFSGWIRTLNCNWQNEQMDTNGHIHIWNSLPAPLCGFDVNSVGWCMCQKTEDARTLRYRKRYQKRSEITMKYLGPWNIQFLRIAVFLLSQIACTCFA